MDSLNKHRVYRIIKGRMLMDDEIVKDVILIGLQNMTGGDKNPISDYNLTFSKQQKRRAMKPVSEDSKLTAVSPSPIPPTVQTPIAERPPNTPVPPPQTALLDEDDKFDDVEANQKSELEQILEDLDQGVSEPTLSRTSEEDVAYDMDQVVREEGMDGVLESDSESDSDSEWEEA